MHRGARREPIFRDDRDALLFFEGLEEAVERFRVEVHAYSLMPNHYHLLVHSPYGTLSRAMRHVNGVFTQRVNQREQWDGPVFRGRFASQLIEDEAWLEVLVAYLHLNPVRAHLVKRPDDDCWTSHQAYLGLEKAPAWLTRDEMLNRFGGAQALHRYVMGFHDGSREWPEGFADAGWLSVLPEPEERVREQRAPQALLDPEAVLATVTRLTGEPRERLLERTKGPRANPARRLAAWALRRSTLLSHAEIGELLGMRAPHVASLLRRAGDNPTEPLAGWLRAWELQASKPAKK